jgi:hypothetical protein
MDMEMLCVVNQTTACDGIVEAFSGRAVLFDREGRIIHANEKAKAFFNHPLLTRHDLPEELTAGLDDVLAKGRRIAFCYQEVAGGPVLRNTMRPLYLYGKLPEEIVCAILRIEENTGSFVPESIATYAIGELSNCCTQHARFLKTVEAYVKRHGQQSVVKDWASQTTQAGERLIKRVTRVANILKAVASGDSPLGSEKVSLASLITEAATLNKGQLPAHEPPKSDILNDLHRSMLRRIAALDGLRGAKRVMVCKGPDDLAFSTGNPQCLRILFSEILGTLGHPSIQWAEDNKKLGVPAAKVEFSFDFFPDSRLDSAVYHASLVGQRPWFDLATEIVLNAHGCLELTPDNPATLCLWLPLTLSERF